MTLVQRRVDFIDLIKGYGIILVVWGHTFSPRSVYLYSFHMPLFFFVSGFLFKEKPFSEFIMAKIKRLYLPYVVFCLVSWLFYLLVPLLLHKPLPPGHGAKIISVLSGTAANGGNDPIWFLPCLMVVSLLFLGIRRLQRPPLMAAAVIAASLLSHYLGPRQDGSLFFKADIALSGVVFYALGYYCKAKDLLNRAAARFKRVYWIAAVALFETVHILTAHANISVSGIDKVSMISNVQGNYLLYHLSALAGIAAVLAAGFTIKRFIMLNYLGVNSLIVLACHKPILYLLQRGLDFDAWGTRTVGLLATVMTIALTAPVIWVSNKYLPWLAGKGWRPRLYSGEAMQKGG